MNLVQIYFYGLFDLHSYKFCLRDGKSIETDFLKLFLKAYMALSIVERENILSSVFT